METSPQWCVYSAQCRVSLTLHRAQELLRKRMVFCNSKTKTREAFVW
jgi:hypothetical protein